MPLAPAVVRGCRGAAKQLQVQLEISYAPVPRLRGTAAELPTHQLGRAAGALEVAQGKILTLRNTLTGPLGLNQP